MSFFSNIYDAVKKKQAELKERKEFLEMVESKARPIRRAAYMKQTLLEVVKEGITKAKLDASKKVQPKKKNPEDFGIGAELQKGLDNPFKFLDPPKEKNKEKKEVKKKK